MAEYASAPEYYETGNYIHRLYLNRNPLIQNINEGDRSTNLANQKLTQLIAEEDSLLSSFAASLGESATPETGLRLINQLLAGSTEALQALAKILIDYIDKHKGNGQINFNTQEARNEIIGSVVGVLEGTYKESSVIQSLQKGYSDLYDAMIKNVNGLLTTSGARFKEVKGAAQLEGYIHELIVVGIFNLNLMNYMSKNQEKIREDILEKFQSMAVEASARAVGDNKYRPDQIAQKGRYYSHDMTIPLSDFGENLNLQLKAKPISKTPEVRVATTMEMSNLISNVHGTDKKAIKTALINQHFWGLSSYKSLVMKTLSSERFSDMQGVYTNLSSIDTTALERLDYSKTLNVLQPVIPVLERAVFDHLISGISDAMNTHLWVITDKSGYTIIRSSAIISRLMGKGNKHSLKDITRKGVVLRQVRKGLDELKGSGKLLLKADSQEAGNISSYYKRGGTRDKWYRLTAGIAHKTYNQAKVTMTFDYANMK